MATVLNCPKCSEPIAAEVFAKYADESHTTLNIELTKGCRMDAKTLGGMITSYVEMTQELAKTMGVETAIFIDGLAVEEDKVKITFQHMQVKSHDR